MNAEACVKQSNARSVLSSPWWLHVVSLIGVLLLLVPFSQSQGTTSSIYGGILDSSGAAIPGAKVTVTNTATNVKYPTTSDSGGTYRVTQLPPGTYTLQVLSPGFATQQTTPFTLLVDQQSQQNITLAPGAAVETVSVTASSLLLDEQTSGIGQVIENQQIIQLPLNGRDFLQLANLTAGVTPIQTGSSSSPGSSSAANQWSGGQPAALNIAGLREDDISYLYDGIETRNAWYGAEGLLPSVDNIQEFRVEQLGSSAAYGDAAAFVNTVTRSGTNSIHGTVYEFLRNNDFDARNYFDIGAPPPFHQNQFGGSIGGPILKDKLFFFLNYEGFRQISPNDLYSLVPSLAQRAGNFSADTTQLLNPYAGYTPFAGNQIPVADFNPIGQKVLALYPLPNGLYQGGTNYFNVADTIDNWNQENGRIDWNPRTKDSLFVRMTIQSQSTTQQGVTPYNTQVFPSDPKNLAVGWTHTFSPNLVNNLRFGWSHTSTGENRGDAYNPAAVNPLGLANEEDQPGSYGPPSFGIPRYANPGSIQGTDIMREGLIMTTDSLLLEHGKHDLSIGADIRYDPTYFYEDWAATSLNFNGVYTGDPAADILLGIPTSSFTAIGNPTLNLHRWYQGYYVQDSYRATSRLTLNAGLRWDHNSQPIAAANNVGSFDFATGQDLTYPATNILGLGRNMVHPVYHDFGPRLGFNWLPFKNGKTDIKGGAGLYFLQTNMNQYEVEVDTVKTWLVEAYNNSVAGTTPYFNLSNLFSTTVKGAAPTASFMNPHNPDPYTYEWNLTIDHTLNNWLFEVADIGTVAHHFEERPNVDPLQPNGTTPIPQFAALQENTNSGSSSYNGVFGRVERRYSSGFSVDAAYTYSKCFSDPFQDAFTWHPLKPSLDSGHCSYSLDSNLTANAIYQFPFGKGKLFMNSSRLADEIAGGWEITGIASLHSGQWLTLSSPQNMGIFVKSEPNAIGPINNSSLHSGLGKNQRLGPYFNTQNVVAVTATGIQGNSGVQNIESPGGQDYDLSLDKGWSLYGRANLVFRGDFFNAFNHPQFGGLDTGVTDATFGQVTNAAPAREIQLSLRLTF